mgnify:CR=1 FL=1
MMDWTGARCVRITNYDLIERRNLDPVNPLWSWLSDAGWPGVVVPHNVTWATRRDDILTGDVIVTFVP